MRMPKRLEPLVEDGVVDRVIIDLRQVADAARSPNARSLFLRDVGNLTSELAKCAPSLAATRFGPEIWSLYEEAAAKREAEGEPPRRERDQRTTVR